jgi:hypothetical protein
MTPYQLALLYSVLCFAFQGSCDFGHVVLGHVTFPEVAVGLRKKSRLGNLL